MLLAGNAYLKKMEGELGWKEKAEEWFPERPPPELTDEEKKAQADEEEVEAKESGDDEAGVISSPAPDKVNINH